MSFFKKTFVKINPNGTEPIKYDKTDIWQARKIIQDLENEIYIGQVYEDKNRKNYYDVQDHRKNVKTVLRDEVKHYDILNLI